MDEHLLSTLGQRSPRLLRVSLCAMCALSSFVFGWAALSLPLRHGTVIGTCCALLAAEHAVTLGCAVTRPEWLPTVWRVLSWSSLAAALVFVGAVSGASIELVAMYGALGWGLTALLAAISILFLAATLPVAVWGLWLTRRRHAST